MSDLHRPVTPTFWATEAGDCKFRLLGNLVTVRFLSQNKNKTGEVRMMLSAKAFALILSSKKENRKKKKKNKSQFTNRVVGTKSIGNDSLANLSIKTC